MNDDPKNPDADKPEEKDRNKEDIDYPYKDEEDDLSKFDDFWDDMDDGIKPIDMQDDPVKKSGGTAAPSNPAPSPEELDKALNRSAPKKKDQARQSDSALPPEEKQSFNPGNPVPPADEAETDGPPLIQPEERKEPSHPDQPDFGVDPMPQGQSASNAEDDDKDEQKNKPVPSNMDKVLNDENEEKARRALSNSNSMVEERMLRDLDEEETRNAAFLNISDRTMLDKGDYFDIMAHDPSIHDMYVGVGWDQKAFEEAPVDVDLSLFLLNKEGQTREDEDFVFYNQMVTCEGAVKLMEDSRTGAGDGDDERVFLDVNGIPFDVLKIRFALSIYDEKIEGFNFDLVRNVYIRLVNNITQVEVFCFEIDPEEIIGATAIEVGTLVREGPKWFFEAETKVVSGGLKEVAKSYGMLINEDTG